MDRAAVKRAAPKAAASGPRLETTSLTSLAAFSSARWCILSRQLWKASRRRSHHAMGVANQELSLASVNVETGLSAGDCVKDGSAGNGAEHLGNDIRRQLAGPEAPTGPKAYGDSWIQMTTRDMANSEGHGQHGKPERQRYADESNTKLWKGRG